MRSFAERSGFRVVDRIIQLLIAGSLASGQAAQAQSQPRCVNRLADSITPILTRPQFRRAHWGILVQTLSDRPQTLYALNAEQFFIPASNAKLLTTAAALETLGSQFRIRTSVEQIDRTAEGVVLRVVGRGDPSLTKVQLQALAEQIADRGITRIARLVGDESYFPGDPINLTWDWEDIQAGYGAPATSFILNENAIGLTLTPQAIGQPLAVTWDDPTLGIDWQIDNQSVTVAAPASEYLFVGRTFDRPIVNIAGQLQAGSLPEKAAISVPNPTQAFLTQFRQTLEAAGISVAEVIAANAPSGTEIAAVQSPPIADLMREANQESNNLYAEVLLRQTGMATVPETTSALDAGINRLNATLAALGVDQTGISLRDGSGLSRQNLVTPTAIVQTLQGMATQPQADVYRASLAVAGSSGTLAARFQNTAVAGRLQGKTGALSGVAALSGYLTPPQAPPVAFSILVNQFDRPVSEVRSAIDEITLLLATSQSCASQPNEPSNGS